MRTSAIILLLLFTLFTIYTYCAWWLLKKKKWCENKCNCVNLSLKIKQSLFVSLSSICNCWIKNFKSTDWALFQNEGSLCQHRCKKRKQTNKRNTHSLNRNKNKPKTHSTTQHKIVIIQSNVNCLKLDESRVSSVTSHQKAVRLYSKRYTECELIFGLECRSSLRLTWIRCECGWNAELVWIERFGERVNHRVVRIVFVFICVFLLKWASMSFILIHAWPF